MKISKLGFY